VRIAEDVGQVLCLLDAGPLLQDLLQLPELPGWTQPNTTFTTKPITTFTIAPNTWLSGRSTSW